MFYETLLPVYIHISNCPKNLLKFCNPLASRIFFKGGGATYMNTFSMQYLI